MTDLREWEHNHETTEHFAFTGGTEMTSQDNLRDRMAEVLSRTYTSGPAKVTLEDIAAAQAIIDHLGLTIETHATDQSRNPHTRIISEWKRP